MKEDAHYEILANRIKELEGIIPQKPSTSFESDLKEEYDNTREKILSALTKEKR